MTTPEAPEVVEFPGRAHKGALVLVLYPIVLIAVLLGIGAGGEEAAALLGVPLAFVALLCLGGFFVVQPNTSCTLVFFGKYRGTIREEGFYWVRPFMAKKKISLRANNVASETIKVNDLNGNPIEIGAVVVWRVSDTAKASFDVEDYEDYVNV